MKVLSMLLLLIVGLTVSACWEDEKAKRASDFMSTLSKCTGCDKPFTPFKTDDQKEGDR